VIVRATAVSPAAAAAGEDGPALSEALRGAGLAGTDTLRAPKRVLASALDDLLHGGGAAGEPACPVPLLHIEGGMSLAVRPRGDFGPPPTVGRTADDNGRAPRDATDAINRSIARFIAGLRAPGAILPQSLPAPPRPAASRRGPQSRITKEKSPMSEANKAIVRRFCEDMLTAHNLEVSGELFTDDFIDHAPDDPREGRRSGVEGAKREVAVFTDGLPDIVVRVDDLFAEGDRVVLRATVTGTHTGTFVGIPPTGKSVNVKAIQIFRFTDGKIAEAWLEIDRLSLLQQLGVIPAPGEPVAAGR
jgi:steroid delta-isomerase-like uncharacterized protein